MLNIDRPSGQEDRCLRRKGKDKRRKTLAKRQILKQKKDNEWDKKLK